MLNQRLSARARSLGPHPFLPSLGGAQTWPLTADFFFLFPGLGPGSARGYGLDYRLEMIKLKNLWRIAPVKCFCPSL